MRALYPLHVSILLLSLSFQIHSQWVSLSSEEEGEDVLAELSRLREQENLAVLIRFDEPR